MCRIAKSTCAKHQTEEAFCQMVKTPLFLASLEEAGPAVSGKDGACVCGRQKGTCWRPAGYVHPTLEANAAGEET